MKKQIMPAVKTHLLRGACLLALLFLVIQVMPRALGQRQTSNRNPAAEAPGMSNVNDAVPEVPTVCPGWSAGADLPSPGVRLAGVYFPANGKFYGMGGRSSDVAGSDFTHPFEYDPGTNTWTIKSATYPDNQVNNMACGVLNDNGTD